MAASGYTPIILLNSTTTGNTPTTSNLAVGELAINVTDGKLFFNQSGTIKVLANATYATSVSTISFGTTGLTPSTATNGVVTVAGTLATTNGGTGLTSFTSGGVVYASSTSALATGSALTFDGTNLALGRTALAARILTVQGRACFTASANDSQLAIYSDGSTNGLYSTYNSTGSYLPMTFFINDSEQMRLTSTGLGIGTSSPAYKLDVARSGTGFTARIGNGTTATYFYNDSSSTYIGGDSSVNNCMYIYPAGNQIGWATTNGTTKMLLDGSGNLGLGVTPSAWLSTWKAFQIGSVGRSLADTGAGSGDWTMAFNAIYSAANSRWDYAYTGDNAVRYSQTGSGIHAWYTSGSSVGTAGNAITFTQAMTLDASGNLLVGTTTAISANSVTSILSLQNNTDTALLYMKGANNTKNSVVALEGTGQWVAYMAACPSSSAGWKGIPAAAFGLSIASVGIPMVFATSATEQMRIDSSGNVGIGATDIGYKFGVANNGNQIYMRNPGYGGFILSVDTGVNLGFNAEGIGERMRIDSSGNLLVGATSTVLGARQYIVGTNTNYVQVQNAIGSGTYYLTAFRAGGTDVGAITSNGTITVYNTTSDYRLKNITGSLTGAKDFIMALQPKQGTWKTDGSKFVGFVAHEFQEVSPSSVTGIKDAIDEKGNPIYQGMQSSSSEVMANLISLVQEQQALIESLTTRLTALENK